MNMAILTSFPDLPFTNHGKAELRPGGTHSAVKWTSQRHYPRTDLKTLAPWTSFPTDIHQAIESKITHTCLPSTPFAVEGSTARFVDSEEMVHTHAVVTLHEPVEKVLQMLGVNGWFARSRGCMNLAIVGDPDFSWITQRHPKVIVTYKTWWSADLRHVVDAFNGTRNDTLSRQSLQALQQIYGYMTFNNNKFGILTNWRRALFLRRAETSDRQTLEYYSLELEGPGQSISMLKAWVGLVLLAEDDWCYPSPTISPAPPDQRRAIGDAQGYHLQPVSRGYQCLTLGYRLCFFDLNSARHGAGASCLINARILEKFISKRDHQVICKVVDVLRYPDTAELLDNEAHAYAALQHLQGKVIPTLYGFYEVWGILQLLALEPVGNAIPEDEQISQTLRTKMKAALQYVHDAGFIHGDIARRNFCRTERGDIFLVDLERCQRIGNPSEPGEEMDEVDQL